jgi:hypothetical protein
MMQPLDKLAAVTIAATTLASPSASACSMLR